jgi:bifunctional non-homologous end joining protein LigD
MGTLEFHAWGSRADDLEHPDRLVMDLDPAPDVPFTRVVRAAQELRERLKLLGLASFVKTTGGKALHVVVPLAAKQDWGDVKPFARALAEGMAADAPDLYLSQASKEKRTGKIYVDWLRNGRGATAVAAYSTRAKPGATVSAPLAWDELGPRLKPDRWHLGNVPGRLRSLRKDPWAGFLDVRQDLARALRAMGRA